MRRMDIREDPDIKQRINSTYYSRPVNREKIFDVSDEEIWASSIALQRKLQHNKERFNHRCSIRGCEVVKAEYPLAKDDLQSKDVLSE